MMSTSNFFEYIADAGSFFGFTEVKRINTRLLHVREEP